MTRRCRRDRIDGYESARGVKDDGETSRRMERRNFGENVGAGKRLWLPCWRTAAKESRDGPIGLPALRQLSRQDGVRRQAHSATYAGQKEAFQWALFPAARVSSLQTLESRRYQVEIYTV